MPLSGVQDFRSFVRRIRATGGCHAADWTAALTSIRKAQQEQLASSSTGAEQRRRFQSQLLEVAATALFTFQTACDRNSGELWVCFFESHLRLHGGGSHETTSPPLSIALFELALSLPIGERALKRICELRQEWLQSSSPTQTEEPAEAQQQLATRIAAALQLSREENRTWPLRTNLGDEGEGEGAASPSTAALLEGAASHHHVQHSLYCAWARVLQRRLRNPTCIRDAAAFGSFVAVAVRQMLSDLPAYELAHVAAFLAMLAVAESKSASASSPSVVASSLLGQVRDSLALLARTRGIALPADSNNICVTAQLVASFPHMCAVFEAVAACSSNNGSFAAQLRATTDRVCAADGGAGTLAFAWVQNMWKCVMADAIVPPAAPSEDDDQNAHFPSVAGEGALPAIIAENRKHFRAAGKAAVAAGTGDSVFYAEWARGEQLLLRDGRLHPEIFRQAAALAPREDPAGAAAVIRVAAECLRAQREEGSAGTVLERAVDRVRQQQLRAVATAAVGAGSGVGAVGGGDDGDEPAMAPSGSDVALWSAFSEFVASQNAPMQACEEVEARRRAVTFSNNSGMLAVPVEDSSRRVAPTPAETYLFQLRQLALGNGVVLPTHGGDAAWALLLRDAEVARRSVAIEVPASASAMGGGGVAASTGPQLLPVRARQPTLAGLPSLLEYGANGVRLPTVPGTIAAAATATPAGAATSRSFVLPEFIHRVGAQRRGRPVDDGVAPAGTETTIVWSRMTRPPENPNPPRPVADFNQLDDVTGPQSLRPAQVLMVDQRTRARLERQEAAQKGATRAALLETLAEATAESLGLIEEAAPNTTATGAASAPKEDEAAAAERRRRNRDVRRKREAILDMLSSLPAYLLAAARASVVAQSAISQELLEEELSVDYEAPIRPVPSSTFVLGALLSGGRGAGARRFG